MWEYISLHMHFHIHMVISFLCGSISWTIMLRISKWQSMCVILESFDSSGLWWCVSADLLGDLRFQRAVLLAVTRYLSEMWTARLNLIRQLMSFSGRWTWDGVLCPRQRFFPSWQNWKWHSSASATPDSGPLDSVRLHRAAVRPQSARISLPPGFITHAHAHTQNRVFYNRNEIFTHNSSQWKCYQSAVSFQYQFSLRCFSWNCVNECRL